VRIGVLLAALVVGALAPAWYFRDGGETAQAEQAPMLVEFQPSGPARLVEDRGPNRMTRTSGLQTTVPDTLGYDKRTAISVLEEGGFRVRVMNRKVSSSRDEGIVLQQLPRGGVTRRLDWIVTIVVGTLH
jgi:beta-lactam-binding protein with PASTA domain